MQQPLPWHGPGTLARRRQSPSCFTAHLNPSSQRAACTGIGFLNHKCQMSFVPFRPVGCRPVTCECFRGPAMRAVGVLP